MGGAFSKGSKKKKTVKDDKHAPDTSLSALTKASGVDKILHSKSVKRLAETLGVDSLSLYICIFQFNGDEEDDFTVEKQVPVLLNESEMKSVIDYIKVYLVSDTSLSIYLPKIYLARWDSMDVFEGYCRLQRAEVEALISKMEYIMRPTSDRNALAAVSVKDNEGRVAHVLVYKTPTGKLKMNLQEFYTILDVQKFLANNGFEPFERPAPMVSPHIPITTIDKSKIKYIKKLGEGQFGTVELATLSQGKKHTMRIAVKTFKIGSQISPDAPEIKIKQEEFLQEIYIMKIVCDGMDEFSRDSIVHLIGAQVEEPLSMILEYCEGNCVLDYAKEKSMSLWEIILMMISLMNACEHMAKKNIIHFDIAARNLLRKNKTFKLADFGLAKIYQNPNDENSELPKAPLLTLELLMKMILPVRWTAPEVFACLSAKQNQKHLFFKQITPKVNVYQSGMVLLEVVQGGMLPFQNIKKSNQETKAFLINWEREYNTNPWSYPMPDDVQPDLWAIFDNLIFKPTHLRHEPTTIANQLRNFKMKGDKVVYTSMVDQKFFSKARGE